MGNMVSIVLLNVASVCANPPLSTIWKIREENRRDPDVDKSASSSCLMCLLWGFGSANLPLPTIWRIPEENSRKADVDKWALSSCLVCSSELRCVQIHLLQPIWELPKENWSDPDVDNWALLSWVMCFFGSFADANSALSTSSHVVGFGWKRGEWLAFVAIRIIQWWDKWVGDCQLARLRCLETDISLKRTGYGTEFRRSIRCDVLPRLTALVE